MKSLWIEKGWATLKPTGIRPRGEAFEGTKSEYNKQWKKTHPNYNAEAWQRQKEGLRGQYKQRKAWWWRAVDKAKGLT